MSTTDLFVEILVIGVGTAIWIVLLLLSIFGYSWVSVEQLFSIPALLPVFAFIYVLGILTDRISDSVFDKLFIDGIRKKYYPKETQDFDDRRTIFAYSEHLTKLLEYGRSRLRIVRGWTLNFLFILISLNVFTWTRISNYQLQVKISVFGSIFLLVLSILSWYSWRSFVDTDYRKVKGQSAFLRTMGIAPNVKKSNTTNRA